MATLAPPEYSRVPSSDKQSDTDIQPVSRPCKLERQPSATPQSLRRGSTDASSSCMRKVMITVGLVLGMLVVVSTMYVSTFVLFDRRPSWLGTWTCQRERASQPSTNLNDNDVIALHNNVKRQQQQTSNSPTYSTTTFINGQVSTFVYTTRPIVGPQGATIGTLTGYVPLTTSVESSSSSSSTTPTSTSSATHVPSPTYSTTTLSDDQGDATSTATFVYTTRPIINPAGATIGTLTGYVPLTTAISTESKATSEASIATSKPTTEPSSSLSMTESQLDFGLEIDLHLLHKRGLNFESAYEQQQQQQNQQSITIESIQHSKTEFSFATNQQGQTLTFVKTTRPIVGPQGVTIGTLDGAFVKYTPTQTPTSSHDELRRRQSKEQVN
ncbi:hypothetical protein OIO90_006382 [Microbotryomycetes sp. JL221]|nr:hypothetical protein OIO90_006382 [Microbotryomycetes sp. JL221]